MKMKLGKKLVVICFLTIIIFLGLGLNNYKFGTITTYNIGTNVQAQYNSDTKEIKIYSTSGKGTINEYGLNVIKTQRLRGHHVGDSPDQDTISGRDRSLC